jgi:hypothetical protein
VRPVALLALVLAACDSGTGEDAGVDATWVRGIPCSDYFECFPEAEDYGLSCRAASAYTCQPTCTSACRPPLPAGRCCSADRDRPCTVDEECGPTPTEPVDLCTGAGATSSGCVPSTSVCYQTAVGLRRCGWPCDLADGRLPDYCDRRACGPSLDDPPTYVCLPGGPLEVGDPCTASAECPFGTLCAPTGVCARPCPERECPGTDVCVDAFCVASG